MNTKMAKKAIEILSELGFIYSGLSMDITSSNDTGMIGIEASIDITAERIGLDANCNALFRIVESLLILDNMVTDMYFHGEKDNTMVFTFNNDDLDVVLLVKADTY